MALAFRDLGSAKTRGSEPAVLAGAEEDVAWQDSTILFTSSMIYLELDCGTVPTTGRIGAFKILFAISARNGAEETLPR